jgi:hypothetical protein
MSLETYRAEIAKKRVAFQPRGLSKVPALNASLFPHQEAVTDFALRTGSSALFLDTGLGKTFCALEWGRVIVEATNKPVLMLAPLACAAQHQGEGQSRGIDAKAVRDPREVPPTYRASRPTWGHCFYQAGWRFVRVTKKGQHVLECCPEPQEAAA